MISMLVNETLIVTSSTSTTEDTSSSAHSSFRFNQKEHFLPPEHFFTFWKDFRRTKKSYLLGLSLPEITPTFTLPSGACGLTVLLEDTFFFLPPNDTLALAEIQPMTFQLDSLPSRFRAAPQRAYSMSPARIVKKIISKVIQYFQMGWNKFLTRGSGE